MGQRKTFEHGAQAGLADATGRLDTQFTVVTRDFGAIRVLGIASEGAPSFQDLQSACQRLRQVETERGLRVRGPIMTLLRCNPFEVGARKRSVLTCFPIEGRVEVPDGFELARVDGGMHLLVGCRGPLVRLEDAYAFLFGRFLEARGYELARPSAPVIRQLFARSPIECETEEDLIIEVAVPVSIVMRTDTLHVNRFTGG